MSNQPLTNSELRASVDQFIQLPGNPRVIQVIPYRVEGKRYPKWKFWRNEKIKYNLAVLVEGGRFYIVDPDNLFFEEKQNQTQQ